MTDNFEPDSSDFAAGCLGWLVALCLFAHNHWFGGQHSWWIILAPLPIATLLIGPLIGATRKFYVPQIPSDEDIDRAFLQVDPFPLRAFFMMTPVTWKYKKMGVGVHMMTVAECGHQAAIVVELTYLHQTEVRTLPDYFNHAVEFCRQRGVELVSNHITRRWGLDVHEFVDRGPRTYGHRVTVPFHGTEFGFQLRLNDPRLAEAAEKCFERFLQFTRMEPAPMSMKQACGGRLRLRLPIEFINLPGQPNESNHSVWHSQIRMDCTLEAWKLESNSPMSPALLSGILERCFDVSTVRKDFAKADTTFSLVENGFGGHLIYLSSRNACFVAAVGDLPTGGRYLLLLDDRDPRQMPYMTHYTYLPFMLEVLVSLEEKLILTK